MNAAEALREIGHVLSEVEESQELSDVWAVLSALRGPDSGNDRVKSDTTCRIRGELIRNYGWPEGLTDIILFSEPGDLELDTEDPALKYEAYHFKEHVRYAFEALQILRRRNEAP